MCAEERCDLFQSAACLRCLRDEILIDVEGPKFYVHCGLDPVCAGPFCDPYGAVQEHLIISNLHRQRWETA